MELQEFKDLSNSYSTKEERLKLKQAITAPPIAPNKRTIVLSTPSETGTSHFRILEPAFSLMRHYSDDFNIVYTEEPNANHFELADILILHRADQRHSKFIEVASKWPKNRKRPLIIHDVDDNEFQLAKNHSMKDLWYAFEKDQHSLLAVKKSDYIVTTGKGLENAFRKYNKNIRIFRNYFNWNLPQWNLFKEREEFLASKAGKIIIGYAGLSSHQDDIRKLAKAWKIIHDKYPQAYFILSGVVKIDIAYSLDRDVEGKVIATEQKIEDPKATYRARIEELFKDFDKDRIELQDSKDLENYGEFYSQYHINCSFIEKNAFNACKSDIKVIEGLHYESIPLFSYWGPYAEFYDSLPQNLKNENIRCLTEREDEWADRIGYWIENIESGLNYAKELKKHSDQISDMDSHIHERFEYLNQIADKHDEEEILKTSKFLNLKID